jgi:hypothetical protein
VLLLASRWPAGAHAARRRAGRDDLQPQLWRDLRAVWLGRVVFWVAWMSGPVGATLSFRRVLVPGAARVHHAGAHAPRRPPQPDAGLLRRAAAAVPAGRSAAFDLFTVFIPVYVFLAIPVVSALAGDPARFLERNAKIQWGIMVCVYGLSHAPALLLLDLPRFGGRGAFLLFFLVVVVAAAQITQELASRWLRRRPVVRQIDRSFSWRAWWLGVLAALRGGWRCSGSRRGKPGVRGDGCAGRWLRHPGRPGDARAQEGRRRALLGQPQFGHRRRGPAGPRGAAVLCGAGVLPFGALVLCLMNPRHRPRPAAHRLWRHRCRRARLAYVASGTISTLEAPRGDLPLRLKIIFEGVREVVQRYTPDCATVEIVFVNVNPQSTLLLGQAAAPRWRRWCPVACRWRSTPRCR